MRLPPSPLSPERRAQATSAKIMRSGRGHGGGAAQNVPSIPATATLLKAHYAATQASRFRRDRGGLGGTADAHYALGLDYYRLREMSRDMDRNDAVIGQLVDRACDNIGPLLPIPQTGNKEVDKAILRRWVAWAYDKTKCDESEKFTFPEMERLIDRSEFIDGDIFALPLDTGRLQVVEADYVDSPLTYGDVVHGVKIGAAGQPLEYWFLEEPVSRRTMMGPRVSIRTTKIPAVGADGLPNVFHVFDPSRFTQNRGVTVFKAVMDISGMFEDTNFATLVKQQVAACIAAFVTSAGNTQVGSQSSQLRSDGDYDILEELSPGLIARLRPGETVSTFSPSVPSAEYFDHVHLLLRLIGAALGMPLCLVLLDTSNTTFHGYRGELQQARIGFERRREARETRFNRPVYAWKMKGWWIDELRKEFGAAVVDPLVASGDILKHKWTGRRFPYVEPKTDAEADKVRLDNLLISPRDLATERGDVWEDIVRETVEDKGMLVRAAILEAQAIEKETGIAIGWRDLLNWSTPAGVQAKAGGSGDGGAGDGGGGDGGNSNAALSRAVEAACGRLAAELAAMAAGNREAQERALTATIAATVTAMRASAPTGPAIQVMAPDMAPVRAGIESFGGAVERGLDALGGRLVAALPECVTNAAVAAVRIAHPVPATDLTPLVAAVGAAAKVIAEAPEPAAVDLAPLVVALGQFAPILERGVAALEAIAAKPPAVIEAKPGEIKLEVENILRLPDPPPAKKRGERVTTFEEVPPGSGKFVARTTGG